ncbi:MAG: 6-pyruvoyl tetrahydropterin synthase family protein [Gemmatimonadales bacterium]
MPSVTLTRVVHFNAAHRYFRPEWSAEKNREVFGACSDEHGHGHQYECHVTVSGDLQEETGMVSNLGELDRVLEEEITQALDHRHLNQDVPEFAFGQQIPTTEALAVYIWRRVAPRLQPGAKLERVRVYEDPLLYAEYDGSD